MYIAYLGAIISIHPARKNEIALLITEKVAILAKYLDYTNVFLKNSVVELFEQSDIKQHAITLDMGKQLPSGLIYSLKPMEFKNFMTFIEINLANNFIHTSNFPIGTPILFVQKLINSFCLYVDY